MSKFKGFVRPKSNYFRLPNNWMDITHDIKSLAVLKLVEYVLRHTWGYNGEENRAKRISIDEFMYGRKKKGGGRIDRGTGLSAGSVSSGLRQAIDDGYLKMDEDDTDGGRVKRFYSLTMAENKGPASGNSPGQGLEFGGLTSEFEPIESEGQPSEFGGPRLENGGRSRKDNHKKDNRKKEKHKTMSEPDGSDQPTEPFKLSNDKPSSKRKKQPTKFDERAATEFAKVVSSFRKVQKNSDLQKWANTFRVMREVDGVSKKEIRKLIEWYGVHIGEDYVPEAYSVATLRSKYAEGKFTSAMKRSERDASSNGRAKITRENMHNVPSNLLPGGILKIEVGPDGKQYDGVILHRIRRQVLKRFGPGLPLPEELDAVLKEEFPEVKRMLPTIIGRVG